MSKENKTNKKGQKEKMQEEEVVPQFVSSEGDNWVRISSNLAFTLLQCLPVPIKQKTKLSRKNASRQKHEDDDVEEEEKEEWVYPVPRDSRCNTENGLEEVLVVGLRCGQQVRCRIRTSGSSKEVQLELRTVQRFGVDDLRNYLFPEQLLFASNAGWSGDDLHQVILGAPPSCNTLLLPMVPWKNKRHVQQLLSRCFYEGLFTLPNPGTGEYESWALPNGGKRYCIDLVALNHQTAPSTEAECNTAASASDPLSAPSSVIDRSTWFRSRKLRRLVRRGGEEDGLQLVVNRNIEQSLRLAQEYHLQPKKTRDRDGNVIEKESGTWITESLIKSFALMAAVGPTPEGHGVKLCAVELLNREGEVLAGCLGFALGSVYHDYTMFTCKRSQHSYGNMLTRLLGCALQHAGYKLWYWGFKLGYMEEFVEHCGGVDLPRDEFYRRWVEYRDELPIWSIDVFINSGKGALPSPTSRPPATQN